MCMILKFTGGQGDALAIERQAAFDAQRAAKAALEAERQATWERERAEKLRIEAALEIERMAR